MATPDFFIVGFPKCGTTSLASFLSSREGLYCSSIKEPHFFTPEFPVLQSVSNETEYEALFNGCAGADLIFEASTWYVYSPTALTTIINRNPNAKFIVCLRNPAAMALSFIGHAKRKGYENITDPILAWEAQGARSEGENLPPNSQRHEVLRYKELTSIGFHLKEVLNVIPNEQVFPVFLEELVGEREECMLQLEEFLGVSGLSGVAIPVENKGRLYRRGAVSRFALWLSQNISNQLRPLVSSQDFIKKIYRKLVYEELDNKSVFVNGDFFNLLAEHSNEQMKLVRELCVQSSNTRIVKYLDAVIRE